MTKNKLFCLILAGIFGLSISACTNDAEQAAKEELKEEILTLDSLSNDLDTLTQTIEDETKALQNALDALDEGEEQ